MKDKELTESQMGCSIQAISDAQQAKHFTDGETGNRLNTKDVAKAFRVVLEAANRDPETLNMFSQRVLLGRSYRDIAVRNGKLSESTVQKRVRRLQNRLGMPLGEV